jgi:uncharacterized protein YceH (UPF0502 family)
MYRFEHLDDVLSTLQRLIERESPLVRMLPRQPGTKESRYAHLLSGDVEGWTPLPSENAAAPTSSAEDDRIGYLEQQVEQLKAEMTEIKQEFAEFRKAFE